MTSDFKDLLTNEESSKEEIENYAKEHAKVNAELLDCLPCLREQFKTIKDGKAQGFEVRDVRLGMPPKFWECFEKVLKIFQLREEFQIEDLTDENELLQSNVIKSFKENSNLITSEILMSQFLLDTVLQFAVHVARAELMNQLNSAIATQDPEKLIALITNFTGKNPNDPSSNDK